MVPEHKSVSTVVELLNERNKGLQAKHDSWAKHYQDYIVLKYSNLSQQCQTTSNENMLASLLQGFMKKDKEVHSWQECYETLLQNELSFNGSHGNHQFVFELLLRRNY